MQEPLPLIIFKHTTNNKIPIFKDSYDCGWLNINANEPYVLKWGNTKDVDTSRSLMKDVLNKKGNRDVFFYNEELPMANNKVGVIALSKETINDIFANGVKWNSV